MNRTFYALTPAQCAYLTRRGMVYEDLKSGSVIVLGARFMPKQALHIGFFEGDTDACLRFAMRKYAEKGVGRLSCLFPSSALDVQEALIRHGYQLEVSDFIVMEVYLNE
jgi:hypothetical protein